MAPGENGPVEHVPSDDNAAPAAVSHVAAARELGLPPDLLRSAAEWDLIPHAAKRSAYYLVVLADLPAPEEIVRAVRGQHRLHLQQVVRRAETVMAEAEAIQLDALETLESDSDRVAPLGDDTAAFLHNSRGQLDPLSEAASELRLAVMQLSSTQSALELADGPPPEHPSSADRTRLFPPGTPRQPRSPPPVIPPRRGGQGAPVIPARPLRSPGTPPAHPNHCTSDWPPQHQQRTMR